MFPQFSSRTWVPYVHFTEQYIPITESFLSNKNHYGSSILIASFFKLWLWNTKYLMEKYIREQNFNFRYKSQWIMASLFLFFLVWLSLQS